MGHGGQAGPGAWFSDLRHQLSGVNTSPGSSGRLGLLFQEPLQSSDIVRLGPRKIPAGIVAAKSCQVSEYLLVIHEEIITLQFVVQRNSQG